MSIEPDKEATVAPQPEQFTLDEGETRDVVFIIAPPLAQPAVIAAIPSDEGQIALSSTRLTVAAGQTRTTLNVAAIDDNIKELEAVYTIDLSVEGHAELAADQIIVTVPVDGGDTIALITTAAVILADDSLAEGGHDNPVGEAGRSPDRRRHPHLEP